MDNIKNDLKGTAYKVVDWIHPVRLGSEHRKDHSGSKKGRNLSTSKSTLLFSGMTLWA
jgi:hypothetical protein